MPLTRLALYVLSLGLDERARRRAELTGALRAAALRAAGPHAGSWGRVAAVLDDSYSSGGSGEKRRRPLAVALACHFLLEALAGAGTTAAWWTSGAHRPAAGPAVAARRRSAVASWTRSTTAPSGSWSSPTAGTTRRRAWRARCCGCGAPGSTRTAAPVSSTSNPVYDADGFDVRRLAPSVPTAGIRDAEDLPALVEIAAVRRGRARAWPSCPRIWTAARPTSLSEAAGDRARPDRAERRTRPGVGRHPARAVAARGAGGGAPADREVYDGPGERGRAPEPTAHYTSYIPHGFVADWSGEGPSAAYGTALGDARRRARLAAAPDGEAAAGRPAALPAAAPGPRGLSGAALRRALDRLGRPGRARRCAAGSRRASRAPTSARTCPARRRAAGLRDPPGPVRCPGVRGGRARRRLRGAAPRRLPGAARRPCSRTCSAS